jgi:hypothetical protein
VSPDARQTLIFDVPSLFPGPDREQHFSRLPKGESIEIAFAPHQSLWLILAQHRFLLVGGSPYLIIDESGEDARLRPGKNIVGRGPRCDAVLDGSYRTVSRQHLIVEIQENGMTRLTDLSSLGTFIPSRQLGQQLH